MKKIKSWERAIWVGVVFFLLTTSLLGVFVKPAAAGSPGLNSANLNKLLGVLSLVKSDYVDQEKVDEKKLINGAIKGMLEALEDPHTLYLSKEDMDDMNTTSSGKFGGVGMVISEKDDYIIVVTPIENTPAFRKGMRTGDLIISVDGESIKGISVDKAANKLRGEPGTKVTIEFLRDGVKMETDLVRAIIDVPTVKHALIKEKYGYLRITQFSGTTDDYVKKALLSFKKSEVEGIIVDLRYNPGGVLGQVVNIVDFFQDRGVIVSTKGRKMSETDVYKASKFNTIVDNDIPVVVLIDNGSASASEIFSGAIKDLKRGILVGEKSYGKGSVQRILNLGRDGDGLKITTAKYYTPSNVSIDGVGIEPDIVVKEPELTDDEKENLKKLYDNKVIDNLTKGMKSISDSELNAMIEQLHADGYILADRYLKRMIRNSLELTNGDRPIYDLDYDLQLIKAMELLENEMISGKNGKFKLKSN